MSRPIEEAAALTIGTVESVSPSEIRVSLEPGAPQATALNTGTPVGFPRINSYVLIPNEAGAVVGQIVWIGIERASKVTSGIGRESPVIEVPFPHRRLSLTPLGMLVPAKLPMEGGGGGGDYVLERGITVFPSVGDPAQLPTSRQLKCMIEGSKAEDRRVLIGTSSLFASAEVTVDPDKVFGRHLAVLGNTGSGKSCSVAGLIRWSLEAARLTREGRTRPNARFIILDPNGEYAQAFNDFEPVRRFRASPELRAGVDPLLVPAWMWNSQEWTAFANAAPGVQRPLLLQALRDMRSGARLTEPATRQLARMLRSYRTQLQFRLSQGVSGYQGFPQNKNCGTQIANLATDADTHAEMLVGDVSESVSNLAQLARTTADRRHWRSQDGTSDGYNDFSETELRSLIDNLGEILEAIPDQVGQEPVSEDAPVEFPVSTLPDHLEFIATEAPGGQAAQFLATLTMRIRMMLADQRLGPVVEPGEGSVSFEDWLEKYVGGDQASNGELAIVDLSLVPSDVVHIIIAVVARVVFESVQRYHKLNQAELPTVLVLEEAHTFVKRGEEESQGNPTARQMCRQTFERIAREGRKFGLGLVVSSQRPSELSQTVLAQCNTFLLHRIVNDHDQNLVGRLVPDNLGGLLKELPSLPSRQAILLGWATPIPTLVEINELPEEQRPRSSDPRFWAVWTGQEDRRIDWARIGEDWTGIAARAGDADATTDDQAF
ncbi:ATP-binding protein [Gemmatimonadota bacterium]